jgi:hypothetical protein
MTDRYIIQRFSFSHGASEYRAGRWKSKGQGHIYSSMGTALKAQQRIIEQNPGDAGIVNITRV